MDLWADSIRIGWKTLSGNSLRTLLTMLTVALGAGAVALLVSIASSGMRTITAGVDAVGGRELVFVEPKEPKKSTAQTALPLTPEDAATIRDRVPGLSEVSYLMSMRNQVMLGNGKRAEVDVGVGASYQRFLLQDLAAGSFLPPDGPTPLGRVVVLTKPVAVELFGSPEAAVHQPVSLWQNRYEIIGVTKDAPALGFGVGGVSKKRAVFIPLDAAIHAEGITPRGYIVMRDNGTVSHSLQIAIASSIVSWRHRGADDVEFFDLQALVSKFDKVFAGLRVLLALVAAVSLVIAGAGIMNVMLASVRQRVTEIGVRRALGGSQQDIRRQFLVESVLIAGIGGIVGAIIGASLAWGLGFIATRMAPAWANHLSLTATVSAMAASVIIGLVFGLQPARKAATLDVVDCLRGQGG